MKKITLIILLMGVLLCKAQDKIYQYYDYTTEKWGFKNEAGQIVTAPQFESVDELDWDGWDGWYKVRRDNQTKRGVVNNRGRIVIPAEYDFVFTQDNRKFIQVELNEKRGIYNLEGTLIIPLVYDYIGEFVDGIAPARLNDKHGYIDTTGNIIVPFKYDYASEFEKGWAQVRLNGIDKIIDTNGKEFFTVKDDSYEIEEVYPELGFITVIKYDEYDNESYGLMDKYDKIILQFIYSDMYIEKINANYIAVFQGEQDSGNMQGESYLGIIDKKGTVIYPPVFDYMLFDQSNLNLNPIFPIGRDRKCGYGNLKGEIVIPLTYKMTLPFIDGLAPVVDFSDNIGFIDKSGKVVIPIKYSTEHFTNGRAVVKKDGQDYEIDMNKWWELIESW